MRGYFSFFSLLAFLMACSSDPSVILPKESNAKRNRSVIVDSSKCYLSVSGIDTPVACPDEQKVAGGLVGTGMRGINGAPTPPLPEDSAADFQKNYLQISSTIMRIPFGYGCNYTLQGIWQPKNGSTNTDDLNNYLLDGFETALAAVRNANGTVLWTAGYDLAEGGTCTYANGEQVGKPIADPVKWTNVVRKIMHHYDHEAPEANAKTAVCLGDNKPWTCFPAIFNVEFLRDPFGAGGYVNTAPQRIAWLNAYQEFAKGLRTDYAVPGNDVSLIAPSVVMSADPTNLNGDGAVRSPIYDFIDFVVANHLPLTYLSLEVKAETPLQARTIVKAVADYAAKKGLRHEKNYRLLWPNMTSSQPVLSQSGSLVGYLADGVEPIPIWVTDLHFTGTLPPSVEMDSARKSAYLGAFFAGCKILWQGLVLNATVGAGPRFPSIQNAPANKQQVLETVHDSDFMWFAQTDVANGLLKPAAWYQFWFNDGFMAGAQQVSVLEGPDAYGLSGTADSRRDSGILLMATRETCVDTLGKITNCVADPTTSNYPAVDANRKHKMHVLLVDLDLSADDPVSKLGIIEHEMRLEIKGLPLDTKTVGYRWAYMDGTDKTWCKADPADPTKTVNCKFEFPEQGLLDISQGTFHFGRSVAVPSMHYFEFLY